MSKKNRYKSLRSIVVNGKDYKWMVEKVEDGNLVKIWDSNKKVVYEQVQQSYLTIYPNMVKSFIERK